ncbi:hypothetical protein FSY45_16770 [Comamonas sp. Z1]|nr:hypothetical protein FSY45_16770 [Comamonas sp. Z1]
MHPFGALNELQQSQATVVPIGSGHAFTSGHQPLCRVLHAAVCFFQYPIPPHPSGRLAASLPAHLRMLADSGAYHVP